MIRLHTIGHASHVAIVLCLISMSGSACGQFPPEISQSEADGYARQLGIEIVPGRFNHYEAYRERLAGIKRAARVFENWIQVTYPFSYGGVDRDVSQTVHRYFLRFRQEQTKAIQRAEDALIEGLGEPAGASQEELAAVRRARFRFWRMRAGPGTAMPGTARQTGVLFDAIAALVAAEVDLKDTPSLVPIVASYDLELDRLAHELDDQMFRYGRTSSGVMARITEARLGRSDEDLDDLVDEYAAVRVEDILACARIRVLHHETVRLIAAGLGEPERSRFLFHAWDGLFSTLNVRGRAFSIHEQAGTRDDLSEDQQERLEQLFQNYRRELGRTMERLGDQQTRLLSRAVLEPYFRAMAQTVIDRTGDWPTIELNSEIAATVDDWESTAERIAAEMSVVVGGKR